MKPPKRGDPYWDVYVPDLTPRTPYCPFWKCVASCQNKDAKDAVLRLYSLNEACLAEVRKV